VATLTKREACPFCGELVAREKGLLVHLSLADATNCRRVLIGVARGAFD
jgi:hypothetical protein